MKFSTKISKMKLLAPHISAKGHLHRVCMGAETGKQCHLVHPELGMGMSAESNCLLLHACLQYPQKCNEYDLGLQIYFSELVLFTNMESMNTKDLLHYALHR